MKISAIISCILTLLIFYSAWESVGENLSLTIHVFLPVKTSLDVALRDENMCGVDAGLHGLIMYKYALNCIV